MVWIRMEPICMYGPKPKFVYKLACMNIHIHSRWNSTSDLSSTRRGLPYLTQRHFLLARHLTFLISKSMEYSVNLLATRPECNRENWVSGAKLGVNFEGWWESVYDWRSTSERLLALARGKRDGRSLSVPFCYWKTSNHFTANAPYFLTQQQQK